ncbi:MAG: hypothetical protein AAFN93_12295 [Bacteroidota bacterium]
MKELLFLFLLFYFNNTVAQTHVGLKDSTSSPDVNNTTIEPASYLKAKKFQLNGYLKNLTSLNIHEDSTTFDNLVHNRLNLKWHASNSLTFSIEVRNRLFAGNLVKSVPEYERAIDLNNDFFDMSIQGPEGKSWIFQSMIDRAYVEWYKGDWEIRAGRQRINWGVNLVWNPNDLFNAYSFFDFDYEERPGSDAIRVKKYTGFASSIEFAGNFNNDFDEMVFAGMWKVNKGGYDFQLLAGKARQDLALGIGWAGNLGAAGLKGEMTWFNPYTDAEQLSSTLLTSVSVDYSFESSLYLQASVLYNTDGSDEQMVEGLNFGNTGQLTARDLSPFKYSTFLQVGYMLHPLINGGIATIYYPGNRNALFISPNVTFSVKPNLDLDLISQLFFDKTNQEYKNQISLIYMRVKWSF